MMLSTTRMPIVHCYGHGGSGITLAMGCAIDIADNYIQPLLCLPSKSTITRSKL